MPTPFTQWYERVLPEIPGALREFALQHIRDAAIEFCERTCIWVVDHAPIAAVATQGAYPWVPAAGQKVVKAMRAWYDKKPLEPKNEAELAGLYSFWPDQEGMPAYFLSEKSDAFIVVPKPAAALVDGLRAKVAVKPARDATEIESWIYEDYRDVIASGAIARMRSIPGRPYSSEKEAARNYMIYEDGVGVAKERVLKSFGRARPRTRAQFI